MCKRVNVNSLIVWSFSQLTGTIKIDDYGSASDAEDYMFEFKADGTGSGIKEQVGAWA
jgi:hypothetical protein